MQDGGSGVVHRPTSTYRLQLRNGLTLDRLRGLVDYLDALGIGDLYLSPPFRATSQSSHGYDIVDPTEIDPRVGTLEDLAALSAELSRRGMGLILDVVPNHMSTSSSENPWWRDVLENGERSPFARFFDIDWHPSDPWLDGKVLVPVLGEPLSEALEKKKLHPARTEEGFYLRYGSLELPLAHESWVSILRSSGGDSDLGDTLSAMEAMTQSTEGALSRETSREWRAMKGRVLAALERSGPLAESVDGRLSELERGGSEALGELLENQFYRLCHWREASERLNYRRFFDINDLIGVRVEDPDVFAATHELVLSLVDRGVVQGLRIDHIDGLRDPQAYLERLPDDSYVIVEKILEGDEALREWPVAGTTGYETLNAIQEVFVFPAGLSELTYLQREFTGIEGSFDDAVYQSKKDVLETSFGTEIAWLSRQLEPLLERPASSARDALTELVACFPVYRTYVSPRAEEVDPVDRDVIEEALSAAKRRNPGLESKLLDELAAILRLESPASPSSKAAILRREVVLRFQQLTGPAMAKGVEDTAFYRYFPLVALNEVGGGSGCVGGLERFHERNIARGREWPGSLTATSTHDTKRDEDVRARIHVLSEEPERWREAIFRWRDRNHRHHRSLDSRQVPDGAEEYLLYQTLLGSWPLEVRAGSSHVDYVERIQGFMLKALREGKRHTSWLDPDTVYEAAVLDFVARILDPDESSWFLDDFGRFESTVRKAGFLNALSQLVLKAAVPGVPDFYQGTELFELSLVDPDNRRPVDFDERRRRLAAIDEELRRKGKSAFIADSAKRPEDGRLKLHLTRVLCGLRKDRAAFFREAGYRPIAVEGPPREHVIAFLRQRGRDALIVATGRWFQRLPAPASEAPVAWADGWLRIEEAPRVHYREILTDGTLSARASGDGVMLSLDQAFRHAPVALIEAIDE